MSGVRIPIFFLPGFGELILAARRDQKAIAQLGHRADADILGDRPLRENAVGLAVAGNQRDRRRHLDAGLAPARRIEDRKQQIGLAVPGKSGKADDLAFMRDQFLAVALR